ncbi:hypothetical protein HU200_043927 [Digitaria exilis]|uniref:Serine protease n=1 Tax=Digitaria exilis TaxID=1010633 RepID=A0A835EES9_9POAL|nr:hypothetical protein HU200_043927 [Digitaria exilis]
MRSRKLRKVMEILIWMIHITRNFDSPDAEVHTEVEQKLFESVVSISFIGDHENDQYTGLVIKSNKFGSRFVTSATAIRSKEGDRNINMDMTIHVTLPSGEMTRGYLLSVDFDYNIVCIGLGPFHVFKQASLDEPGEVGHNISVTAYVATVQEKIVSLTGVVTEKSTELYGRKLMSTCIIPEFGIGGRLVDSDGNFVGMNISHVDNEGSLFLPRETILESIVPYWFTSTSVVAEEIILRAIMKDKKRRDNQIERSTSEMCKSSTPVVLNSEVAPHHQKEIGRGSDKSPEMNQKSSISPASDSESESSQDTSELSDEPLPGNEFVKAFTNDLLSRGYPLPKKLDGELLLLPLLTVLLLHILSLQLFFC